MNRVLLYILMLPAVAMAAEPVRVFITDSQSWEMRGSMGGTGRGFGGDISGGARPQTAEIIKTFSQRCPQVTVTNNLRRADYVVALDHEGGKALFRRDNKVAVFRRDGDLITSHSTRSLGNSVADACEAILHDAPNLGQLGSPAEAEVAPESSASPAKELPSKEWRPFANVKDEKDRELAAVKAQTPPSKEVRLGMGFAEVEAAFGHPKSKADLGAKVIYRYDAMIVEFRDGKVVDVR